MILTTNKENSNIENNLNATGSNLNVMVPDVCPYCEERRITIIFIYKLKELLIKHQGKKLEAVEQFEFCQTHIAETKIIPDGIKKGYLMEIKFDAIHKRVEIFRSDLLDICK